MKQLLILMLLSFNLTAQNCKEIDTVSFENGKFYHTLNKGNITFMRSFYSQAFIDKLHKFNIESSGGSTSIRLTDFYSEPFIENTGAKIILENNYVIENEVVGMSMNKYSKTDYEYYKSFILSDLDVAMLKLFKIKAYKIHTDVITVSPEDGERYKQYLQCLTKYQ